MICRPSFAENTGKDKLRMLFCRQDKVSVSLKTLYKLRRRNILIIFLSNFINVIGYGHFFAIPRPVCSVEGIRTFFSFSPQNRRTNSIIKDKQQRCLEGSNIQILQSYFHLLEAKLKLPALADNNAGLCALLSTFIRNILSILLTNSVLPTSFSSGSM